MRVVHGLVIGKRVRERKLEEASEIDRVRKELGRVRERGRDPFRRCSRVTKIIKIFRRKIIDIMM